MSFNRKLANLITTTGDVKASALDNISNVNAGLDSADVSAIANTVAGSGITAYDSLGALPITGLSVDQIAFVSIDSNNARYYISNGSGWYNVKLVNTTPKISSNVDSSITLDQNGSTTTFNVIGSDSDGIAVALVTVESDGNMKATGTTLTRDSSVFTLDPLTQESGGAEGNFTLTFTATDGIGKATLTKNVSLEYTMSSGGDSRGTYVLGGRTYEVVKFIGNGNITFNQDTPIEYLILGGGGGGSRGPGGAGGLRSNVLGYQSGGGFYAEAPMTVTAGTYSVVVGQGGASSLTGGVYADSGGQSSFNGIVSLGGGAGGPAVGNNTASLGKRGGSGGGGGNRYTTDAVTYPIFGGAGTERQGFRGGDGFNQMYEYTTGGGGGTGSPGQDGKSHDPRPAGVGTINGITGTDIIYGGGGGGNAVKGRVNNTNGLGNWKEPGGAGGGGYGGISTDSATALGVSSNGVDGLGGGGGAGHFTLSTSENAGDGGDGVVILRYIKQGTQPYKPIQRNVTPYHIAVYSTLSGLTIPSIEFREDEGYRHHQMDEISSQINTAIQYAHAHTFPAQNPRYATLYLTLWDSSSAVYCCQLQRTDMNSFFPALEYTYNPDSAGGPDGIYGAGRISVGVGDNAANFPSDTHYHRSDTEGIADSDLTGFGFSQNGYAASATSISFDDGSGATTYYANVGTQGVAGGTTTGSAPTFREIRLYAETADTENLIWAAAVKY